MSGPLADDTGSTQEDLDLKRALEASLRDSAPPPKPSSPKRRVRIDSDEDDADLNAAIQASLRESAQQHKRHQQSTAVYSHEYHQPAPVAIAKQPDVVSSGELDNLDMFSNIIERMDSNASNENATSILYNTDIQQMYARMGALAPKLQTCIKETGIVSASILPPAANLNDWRVIDDKITNGCRGYDRLVLARIQGGAAGGYGGSGGYSAPQQRHQAPVEYGYPTQSQQQPPVQYQQQVGVQQPIQQYGGPPPLQADFQQLQQQYAMPSDQQVQSYGVPLTHGEPHGVLPSQSAPPQQYTTMPPPLHQEAPLGAYAQPVPQTQQQGFNPAYAAVDDTPLIDL